MGKSAILMAIFNSIYCMSTRNSELSQYMQMVIFQVVPLKMENKSKLFHKKGDVPSFPIQNGVFPSFF